ncbi:MAG: ATP-binding cassette domain-containing protein, partial [Candidatus Saccharimonadales bacterium]
ELEKIEKPSFWIDKESASQLGLSHAKQYEKYKAKNIRISHGKDADSHGRLLVDTSGLSLGYEENQLFKGVAFQLRESGRVELRGRNGAGKTTLIKALIATVHSRPFDPIICFDGTIEVDPKVRIGVYEQEISPNLFDKTLYQAIETIYLARKLSISDTKIRQLMSDYLFEQTDGHQPVKSLSGGQKARLQLIDMLANGPNLLILDEPTNHLDLPSIEELETALGRYHGAILYVSHDSYFQDALAGTVVSIGA